MHKKIDNDKLLSFLTENGIDYTLEYKKDEDYEIKQLIESFPITIQRKDMIDNAIHYISSKKIWGNNLYYDKKYATHVEPLCSSPSSMNVEYEVRLIFNWKKEQKFIWQSESEEVSAPNILYHLFFDTSDMYAGKRPNLELNKHHESRIYPDSYNGLELIEIRRRNKESIILKNPIEIKIVNNPFPRE